MMEPLLLFAQDHERPRVQSAGLASLLGFRARAWTDGSTVFLCASAAKRGLELELVPLLAHEAEHCLKADFSRNEDHHSLLHFCGRAAPPLTTRHLSPAAVALARKWFAELK